MSIIHPAQPQLGTGIYTIADAARLLCVSASTLRRWVEGYVYVRNGDLRQSGPVIDRTGAEPGLLTFFDLVEMFFVREFRKTDVDLPHIREVAEILRKDWKTPYPFAQKRVVELRRQLLDREGMQTVLGQQQVFGFAEEFFKDIDFDRSGLASAWHPLGKDKLIVLDPQRSFGAPIEVRSGIRTDTLYRQFKAEGTIDAVADWYEISPEAVEQAVEFEEKCGQAA
jgi:uncharacterized protein (DUF433 family)